MTMASRLALLMVLIAIPCQQLFITATNRPFCISIDAEPGKTVKFFYEVFGNSPDMIRVAFESATNSRIPFHLEGQSGNTQFSDTSMKVCFLSTDGSSKSVSLDFYSQDVAHLNELASKSDLYELHKKLINVGDRIKELKKNEVFEEERQAIHGRLINSHQSKLKLLVIAKMAVIVLAALGQLFLLKSLLNKSGRGYQPV